MVAIAVHLFTGFYLGIGFGGYLTARGRLGWRYNVFAHILMTFLWGVYLLCTAAAYVIRRYLLALRKS